MRIWQHSRDPRSERLTNTLTRLPEARRRPPEPKVHDPEKRAGRPVHSRPA